MTQHHCKRAVSRRAPVTFLFLVTLAATVMTSLGDSATPFKLMRHDPLIPYDFRPHIKERLQVEKLKAQILRGLNLTAVPEPPKSLKPTSSIHNNHLTVPRNNSRHLPVLPEDIVWSEPVDLYVTTKQKQKDQMLFRVSSQKNKSAVINRVSLILRLRSKNHSKRRLRSKGRLSRKRLPGVKGGGFQNDAASKKERRRKTREKKDKKRRKRKKRRSRTVKVLVQAVNESTGKFKRVVVQHFTVDKKFHWITLPIPASLVARAAHSSNQSLVLRVRCKRCSKQRVSIDSTLPRKKSRAIHNHGSTTSVNLNPNRPYLVIRTADAPLTQTPPSRQRSARHVTSRGSCDGQSEFSNACCAERIRVSFRELGWDHWLVHPQAFTTVVCRGSCQGQRSSSSSLKKRRWFSPSRPGSQSWDRQLGENQHKDWSLGRRFSSSEVASGGGLPALSSRGLGGGETKTCVAQDRAPLEVVYYTDSNTLARTLLPDLLTHSCACLLN